MMANDCVDKQLVRGGIATAFERFHVRIDSPKVIWDSHDLGYCAGACYIYDPDEPTIVLNHIFKRRSKWLSYDVLEILAHELVHHHRRNLHSIKYEEIIAYQTSSNCFRSFWGGVFRRPAESQFFLFAALVSCIICILEPLLAISPLYKISFLAVFACSLVYFVLRHLLTMRRFLRVFNDLKLIEENPLSVLINWDDNRIDEAARSLRSAP